ncbi:hypothetical protein WCX49_08135 [Sulfurimonas sp. HSL-1656]|uniref:hypothetical protein n=1 Tax=Thiomicrolovo subterrani TaxID=3131934 RepID=UPI0031F9CD34
MKIRPLLLAASAAAALSFSGCGEDSSTELRVHLLTMINALDGNISAHHFYGDITPLAPKTSLDDDFEDVSEAPSIWYTLPAAPDTKVGKVTISQGHLINAYIATDCTDDVSGYHNHLYHTPNPGSLNVVNTTNTNFNIDFGGTTGQQYFGACAVREFDGAALSDQSSISVDVDGQTYTVDLPQNGGVYDVVIYPTATPPYVGVKEFPVKAFKG